MIEEPLSPPRRRLPVLELPASPPGGRRPSLPADARLGEFRPEDVALPRFTIWTLGCQMNKSDSEEMAGRLLAAGCAEAPAIEQADLIVINTCAIRETAEAKVVGRQGQLARLREANPALRVVLTGCAVRERDRSRLERRFPAVDLFLRPDEEPELVARLGLASAQASVGLPDGPAAVLAPRTGATTIVNQVTVSAADNLASARAQAVAGGMVARGSRITAWLPIIYGCDKTCTYCIVPFSRGPERSRPFDEVIEEAVELGNAGYREVILLGQNVNSYGHDLAPSDRFAHVATERTAGRRIDRRSRPDLAELIRAIDALRDPGGHPALPRLRFVTSHPWDLSDRLIEAMAECPTVCEHLHLPVQSGDDDVLRRMGRQYTIDHYLERIGALRRAIPGIALSTDVIVGFCGETEAQYERTLELLERVGFDQVFAAAFSSRPGTPATRLPDDVPPAAKRARLNRLLAVQEAIGHERNRAWLGRTVEVLVDGIEPPRTHAHEEASDPPEPGRAQGELAAGPAPLGVRLAGRSREHKLVHVVGPAHLVGQVVDVRVTHAGPFALRGSLA